MNLLSTVLQADPATPRLTLYDETTGARLDFSGITLDNWAAKVANMLREELDMEEGSTIACVLPVSWQAVVIVLGAMAAGVNVTFDPSDPAAEVTFIAFDAAGAADLGAYARSLGARGDIVAVTADPMGRGVAETGHSLADGIIDFAPTVRFYGDQFFESGPTLSDVLSRADAASPTAVTAGARVLSSGWTSFEQLCAKVLSPIATGGSAVVVKGLAGPDRLEKIASVEKATARL
ncbi:TIGR03089 family protein [Corynebacterium sp. SCR221107]|uniref:TIGR03089 family protein n=1 Tax=Corynebacterium sp. SCR221107 TaxID=3017361 RepID=UPI0022EC4623|nr:TIGR03089 family protein [Corynebacterium sp. SCR221107]WBT09329.1 TIGR03089 family protein [Corynebacterium sp. SCR221107]